MGRRRSRARPGRKKGGNRCSSCNKQLHTYTDTICISCEAKLAARKEFRIEEKLKKEEKETKMHIPQMNNN